MSYTIEVGSEAYAELLRATESGGTYKVSFDFRKYGTAVAIKRNEGMWSPSLSTRVREDSYAAFTQDDDGAWFQCGIVSEASMLSMLAHSADPSKLKFNRL